jgi:2-C-methyl-D-erythritol 4-phosphate cytidylyltransferase
MGGLIFERFIPVMNESEEVLHHSSRGSGRRMKSSIPKQFLLLEGKPLLMHTIEKFNSFDSDIEIILVLPPEHHPLWRGLVREYSFEISHKTVSGGEERFHSVRAGLDCVKEECLCAVHDGVRPLAVMIPSGGVMPMLKNLALPRHSSSPLISVGSCRVMTAGHAQGEVRLIQTPRSSAAA